jgi:hypothetical protein
VAAAEVPCELVSAIDTDASGFEPFWIVNGISSENMLPNGADVEL